MGEKYERGGKKELTGKDFVFILEEKGKRGGMGEIGGDLNEISKNKKGRLEKSNI